MANQMTDRLTFISEVSSQVYANKCDNLSSDFRLVDRPVFLVSHRLPYGEVFA